MMDLPHTPIKTQGISCHLKSVGLLQNRPFCQKLEEMTKGNEFNIGGDGNRWTVGFQKCVGIFKVNESFRTENGSKVLHVCKQRRISKQWCVL